MALVAALPPFLLGYARKWYFSHQSLVTPTIRDCTGQYRAYKSAIDCRVLNLRVVMLRLANGDIEYLVTNLSREEFSNEDIAALYRKRWDIEVSFRHQKYAIGGIVFHSKKLNDDIGV